MFIVLLGNSSFNFKDAIKIGIGIQDFDSSLGQAKIINAREGYPRQIGEVITHMA